MTEPHSTEPTPTEPLATGQAPIEPSPAPPAPAEPSPTQAEATASPAFVAPIAAPTEPPPVVGSAEGSTAPAIPTAPVIPTAQTPPPTRTRTPGWLNAVLAVAVVVAVGGVGFALGRITSPTTISGTGSRNQSGQQMPNGGFPNGGFRMAAWTATATGAARAATGTPGRSTIVTASAWGCPSKGLSSQSMPTR